MKQEMDMQNFSPEALALIAKLQAENTALESENTKLSHELLYYKRIFYGRRSEKRIPKVPEGQLFLPFDDPEIPEETPDINPVVEEIQKETRIRKAKRDTVKKKPKRQEIPADIERRIRVIEPQDVNLSRMVQIGEDVREILHYIPGTFYVDRIVRPIYRKKEQSTEDLSTPIYQAEAVESFIPKSFAGNTLLAHLIISKYVDHLPVYRQLELFKRQGVSLAASTISGWMQEVAFQLTPLYEMLVGKVLDSDYIQMDETTLPVIDKEKKRAVKGYIWSVLDMNSPRVFFHYDRGSRSEKTLVSILRNYRGAVQSDAYSAYGIYENKDGVLLLGCWAHARRKFENALSENKTLVEKALDYIGLLYQIEANLKEKDLPPGEIENERKRLSYPILVNFEKWMHKVSPDLLPKSLMGKAVIYTFSIYHRLIRYVSDGKYQIDNNPIENAIRPLALGRKNYLFCGNHDTAEDTALFYSLLGSCKQAGVNPYEWLLYVLDHIKACKTADLDKLLPENWKQKANPCR